MSTNFTKAEIVATAAKETGLTKAVCEKVLSSILGSVQQGLVDGKKITLVGFGTFSVKERQARKGRNPQTKAVIDIPAANIAKFKPGKLLKEAVNQ